MDETPNMTLLVVMSTSEENHRPLDASKITFGSEMPSVPVRKKLDRLNVWLDIPRFVKTSPSTLTISTTWFGPVAICTSGGTQGQLWVWSSPLKPDSKSMEEELWVPKTAGTTEPASPLVAVLGPEMAFRLCLCSVIELAGRVLTSVWKRGTSTPEDMSFT